MGSIARRPDGRWRARVKGPDGKERAKHCDTKDEARRWISTTETAMYRGTWLDPAGGKLLFREWVDIWLPLQVQHSPGTRAVTRNRLDVHLLPVFGGRELRSVRQSDVKAWVAGERMQKLATSTLLGVFRLGGQIFRAAVADGLIDRSPFLGIDLAAPRRAQVLAPSIDTIAAVADAMPARATAAVWVAALAGLREGEVLGLTVDRIDWLRRTIRVDRQLQTRVGEGPVLCIPKTDASARTVPVGQQLLDMLAAHVAEFGEGPQRLLFVNSLGRPWRRATWHHAWTGACTAAGADGLVFHDLRHFYASLLIDRGQSVKVVQARLGHEHSSTTLDVYGHLFPDGDEATRAVVDDVLTGVQSAKSPRFSDRTGTKPAHA